MTPMTVQTRPPVLQDGRDEPHVFDSTVNPAALRAPLDQPLAMAAHDLSVRYGDFLAVRDVNLAIARNKITALIGPSGCGKSTVLRCFNRMNDLIATARVSGQVLFDGADIYAPDIDPVEVRRKVGMVFQKPNPFPKSIYENVAWGARINGFRGRMDDLVEDALRSAPSGCSPLSYHAISSRNRLHLR